MQVTVDLIRRGADDLENRVRNLGQHPRSDLANDVINAQPVRMITDVADIEDSLVVW